MCKENFWRHDRVLGLKCFPCPTGGKCEGIDALPFPEEGYWAVTQTTQSRHAQGAAPSMAATLRVFEPVNSLEMPDDPPYFAACSPLQCLGGETFQCFPGYEGPYSARPCPC
jgi:hypothetical protein